MTNSSFVQRPTLPKQDWHIRRHLRAFSKSTHQTKSKVQSVQLLRGSRQAFLRDDWTSGLASHTHIFGLVDHWSFASREKSEKGGSHAFRPPKLQGFLIFRPSVAGALTIPNKGLHM